MTKELLRVENLNITYKNKYSIQISHKEKAIENISFSIFQGEACAIIGESGGGKSTLLFAIMGLLKDKAEVKGKIIYKEKEIQNLKEQKLKDIRFREIGLVFQNQADRLNPALTIKEQLAEIIRKDIHNKCIIDKRIYDVCNDVGLNHKYIDKYPHELSGGMRQRVFIAMGICLKPPLLLIDEPTTSLDRESKKQILLTLKRLQKTHNISLLIVSHDLETVETLSENMMVILRGNLIEKGKTKNILEKAQHPYTSGLLHSSSYLNPWKDLWGIKEDTEETFPCPFYKRCTQKDLHCLNYKPYLPISTKEGAACAKGGIEIILDVKNITKTFINKKSSNILNSKKFIKKIESQSNKKDIPVLSNCSLQIRHGETVALLGKSGAGKTTLLKIIAGFLQQDSGEIYFLKELIKKNILLSKFESLQIVQQDALSSMNPTLSVEKIVCEPIMLASNCNFSESRKVAIEYLKKIGFSTDNTALEKKANELSGGQAQKIAMARALSMRPKILLADETSSMLDDSAKANLMRELKQLQYETGFSLLLVTHEAELVKKMADYVYCIEAGCIIKEGSVRNVFKKEYEYQ